MNPKRALAWLLVGAVVLPVVAACSSPSSGGKDVLSPAEVKAHKAAKEKKEGGP